MRIAKIACWIRTIVAKSSINWHHDKINPFMITSTKIVTPFLWCSTFFDAVQIVVYFCFRLLWIGSEFIPFYWHGKLEMCWNRLLEYFSHCAIMWKTARAETTIWNQSFGSDPKYAQLCQLKIEFIFVAYQNHLNSDTHVRVRIHVMHMNEWLNEECSFLTVKYSANNRTEKFAFHCWNISFQKLLCKYLSVFS